MASRTVHHAGAAWTFSLRDPVGAAEESSTGLPRRSMELVIIEGPGGIRATQALRVGELASMTDAELAALVQGVLDARRRET